VEEERSDPFTTVMLIKLGVVCLGQQLKRIKGRTTPIKDEQVMMKGSPSSSFKLLMGENGEKKESFGKVSFLDNDFDGACLQLSFYFL